MTRPAFILKLTRDGPNIRVTVEAIEGAPDDGVKRAASRVVALDGLPMGSAPTALQSPRSLES